MVINQKLLVIVLKLKRIFGNDKTSE
jgi:hypothetical protein